MSVILLDHSLFDGGHDVEKVPNCLNTIMRPCISLVLLESDMCISLRCLVLIVGHTLAQILQCFVSFLVLEYRRPSAQCSLVLFE